MRLPLLVLAFAAAALTALAATRGPDAALPSRFHPHFQKKVEARLARGVTLTLSHITVTFDADGAEKMPAGGSWHLGNAHLETTAALQVGGLDVQPGSYALKAAKTEAGGWQLVLDAPGRFKAKVTEAGRPLATEFVGDAPLCEHLSLDVHPSGDETVTKLYLEVRFDTKLARVEVVVPAADGGK